MLPQVLAIRRIVYERKVASSYPWNEQYEPLLLESMSIGHVVPQQRTYQAALKDTALIGYFSDSASCIATEKSWLLRQLSRRTKGFPDMPRLFHLASRTRYKTVSTVLVMSRATTLASRDHLKHSLTWKTNQFIFRYSFADFTITSKKAKNG